MQKGVQSMRKLSLLLCGVALGAVATIAATQPRMLLMGGASAAVTDTYKQLNLFGDVFERVRSDYVEQPDDSKLVESAISGMLSGLDPHSVYMNEAEYKALQNPTTDESASPGLVVTLDNSQLKVVSPRDGSPAASADIKPGDIIFTIDKEPTYDLTLPEIEQKLRGPADSEMALMLRRGTGAPIEIKVKRDKVPFVTDETVRHGTTVEKLAKLPTVFDPEGSVTAGNASGINDAAAAVVLADGEYAKKRGLKPIGRLVGYAYAGVDPKYMGIGPVPAVQQLLKKTGFGIDDIDVFEVNEAFAAQALAVCRELRLPAERTNPNGSGISLGHPLGATGVILTVKALYELARTGGKRALVTMCIGGGQGIAAIFERP